MQVSQKVHKNILNAVLGQPQQREDKKLSASTWHKLHNSKYYWGRSYINCVPCPSQQKTQLLFVGEGGGYIVLDFNFRECHGEILLQIFLVGIWNKIIFLVEYLADRSKFRSQCLKYNFKIEHVWKNIFKFLSRASK